MQTIGRLHVLTDVVLQTRFSHVELAELAIQGGADTIQFRQKNGPTRELIDIARRMKQVCFQANVSFIVNDRIDVAIAADADGVHLGQEDFPIPLARELLGEDKIIGGSAATKEEARKCAREQVDYIGFGPVFPTGSKGDAGPVSGPAILKEVAEEIPLPIIAIGGITAGNTGEVMQTGTHGIAVISSVCCRTYPEQATRELKNIIMSGRTGVLND